MVRGYSELELGEIHLEMTLLKGLPERVMCVQDACFLNMMFHYISFLFFDGSL